MLDEPPLCVVHLGLGVAAEHADLGDEVFLVAVGHVGAEAGEDVGALADIHRVVVVAEEEIDEVPVWVEGVADPGFGDARECIAGAAPAGDGTALQVLPALAGLLRSCLSWPTLASSRAAISFRSPTRSVMISSPHLGNSSARLHASFTKPGTFTSLMAAASAALV